jgi:hypothetical protein
MKKYLVIIIALIILPSMLFVQKVWAEVIFSEVAWMGGVNSSADEWVEIHNNGTETINLEGYVIESESKKLSIKLSGNILAKAYYLVERTDDNSVPNVLADLISTFGTGLSNSGDNLYLKNSEGQVVNSMMFSGGWPAGDNTTKQTMQYVGSNWVTADSTPKKAPIENPDNKPTDPINNDDQKTKNSIQTGGGPTYVPPRNLSRFLITLGDDQLAQIPVSIEIDYRDDYGNKPMYGFYRISFGDGIEKDFKLNELISHTYDYVGEYKINVKFLESVWSIAPKKQTSLKISITEPLIDIDVSRAPILIIKNKSSKDIDLGNFIFSFGEKHFSPPSQSIVFTGKELWFSPNVTGFSAEDFSNAKIYSKEGLAIGQNIGVQNKNTQQFVYTEPNRVAGAVSNKNIKQVDSFSGGQDDGVNIQNLVASSASSDFSKKQTPNNLIVWCLFGVLVFIGSFIFIKLRRVEIDEANDFTLLEE